MKIRQDYDYPEEWEDDDRFNIRWRDFIKCGPCDACEGKGFIYVADGPDDVVGEECPVCEGTGHCNCESCEKQFEGKDAAEEWRRAKVPDHNTGNPTIG